MIEAEVTSKQLVGEFLAWSSGRIRSLPRQRPKGDKIGLYRVRPTKIAMPASSQNWSDKEKETVMVPSIFGAKSLGLAPSQTAAVPQNFGPDIIPADFAPVGAVGANGRVPLDDLANYLANQPAGRVKMPKPKPRHSKWRLH